VLSLSKLGQIALAIPIVLLFGWIVRRVGTGGARLNPNPLGRPAERQIDRDERR